MIKSKNIVIGTSDIAGLIDQYAIGFRACGHKVTTVSIYPRKNFYDKTFDVRLDQLGDFLFKKNSFLSKVLSVILNRIPFLKKRIINKYIIKRNDIFLYIWGMSSMLPDKEDFQLIKKSGGKIIHLFLGSDARLNEGFNIDYGCAINSYFNLKTNQKDYIELIKRIRQIELNADLIYSVPDQSAMQILPFNHLLIPFDAKKLNFNPKQNDIPRIIHCPSRSDLKGTEFIIATINKLKGTIPFTFKIVSNVDNSEILKELNQSDILIDEIILNGPGVLGMEAMSSGCVVMTRFTSNNTSAFSPPIVAIDESNLKTKLIELISNINFRKELSKKGRKWVITNNSPKIVANGIIEKLYSDEKKHDYNPRSNFLRIKTLLPTYLKDTEEIQYLTKNVLNLSKNSK